MDEENVLVMNKENANQLVIEFLVKMARKSNICQAMVGDKKAREEVWQKDRKLLLEPIRKLKYRY